MIKRLKEQLELFPVTFHKEDGLDPYGLKQRNVNRKIYSLFDEYILMLEYESMIL